MQHGGHITKDLLGPRGVPVGGGGGEAPAVFTATTTAPAQTVTLFRLTPTVNTTIDWGDGTSSSVTSGEAGNITHQYASAAAYTVTIQKPSKISHFTLTDNKVSFGAGTLQQMAGLLALNLTGVPVTVSVGEIGTLTNLTSLQLHTLANASISAGEIGTLTNLTSLYLRACAEVTVGAAEIGALTNLTSLYIYSMSSLAFQTGLGNLLKLTSLTYQNSLNQTQVDNVLLTQMYAAFPSRMGTAGTITIALTNAAPSGTLQAQCPPITGKEAAYELANDSCGVSSKHWTTVTITA